METTIKITKSDMFTILSLYLKEQGYVLDRFVQLTDNNINCHVKPIKATKTFIVNIDKNISKTEAEKQLQKIVNDYKEVIDIDLLLPEINLTSNES